MCANFAIIVEQMSVIEKERAIDAETLRGYLPEENTALVPSGDRRAGRAGKPSMNGS